MFRQFLILMLYVTGFTAVVAGKVNAAEPISFDECLNTSVEIVEEGEARYSWHECFRFYSNAPLQEFNALPPQVQGGVVSTWTFQESSGASVTFSVTSYNGRSKESLEEYIDGVRNGFLESGKRSGRLVNATEAVVDWGELVQSASFEASIEEIPMVVRTLILTGKAVDETWVAIVSVVGFDLESARWVAESLSNFPDKLGS